MENKNTLHIIIALIIGVLIGYFLSSSGVIGGNQQARTVDSQFTRDVKSDPVVGGGDLQYLNCAGLGSIAFETPPQAGNPGSSVNINVGGSWYACEWGSVT